MSSGLVQVTYAASLHFLSSDNWAQIRTVLTAQLPLRNLHWKPASRLSVRIIQELNIDLIGLDTRREEGASQIPLTLLERPFLNIYVVTCEDNETYRNTVKKQIKDWHTSVSQRKNQEWLIMYVVRPDARVNAGGLLKMRGTVLDKIRADFNTDKRDRCVQLTWSTGSDSPAAWAEPITKIKESITSAFDLAVAQREEEIKRSESQRQMPGWNFCTFFLLKESLAISFEGMNLLEDARIQYDELEASFFQVLKEKNLSWFGRLIDPGPKDDSLPLLSTTKKPYRDLILANTISVFDFRIYLLARQCNLLGKLGDVAEVGKKVGSFLGAFARRLRDVQNTLPDFFVESWIYSSALSVVENCDDWSRNLELNTGTIATYNSVKGELLENARNQLDRLGLRLGYLPNKLPFSLVDPTQDISSSSPLIKQTSRQTTNADIAACLADEGAFYDLYIRMTNRAIDMYRKAGRRKFALKLHGSLAALDLHRERCSAALQTFTSLPAHYAPHRWFSLESYMLFRSMETHANIGSNKDREWIQIALAFLKTFITDLRADLLMTTEDKEAYVTTLMKSVKEAAIALEGDLIVQGHPAISVKVENGQGRCADNQDGYYVDVVVNNNLPREIVLDAITLTLVGRGSEQLKFSIESTTLARGLTPVTLFCPVPLPGVFLVTSTEVRLAHLVFQGNFTDVSHGRRIIVGKKDSRQLVRLPKDAHALDVIVKQPKIVQLGSSSILFLSVMTGRNKLVKSIFKLTSPDVRFSHSDGTVDPASAQGNTIGFSQNSISIIDADQEQTISCLIPHTGTSSLNSMEVTVDIEYVTGNESTLTRKMSLTRQVTTSLAIAVNVEDFFRGNRLFSKFTVSTTTHQHVRVLSADLQASEEDSCTLKVSSGSSKRSGPITVTPYQPASFIFQIEINGEEPKKPLKFCTRYRLLREEVEGLLSRYLKARSADSAVHPPPDVIRSAVIEILEKQSEWVDPYEVTGVLQIPNVTGIDERTSSVIEMLRDGLRKDLSGPTEAGEWRQFIIPVDMPCTDILAAANICFTSQFTKEVTPPNTPPLLYAGQPITAVVSIHTSFYWRRKSERQSSRYRMQFEVEEMVNDWLISGRRRGGFFAEDGSTYTMATTFIALHHGEMRLPQVVLQVLPSPGEGTMNNLVLPRLETYQVHGAEKVLMLPSGGRTTFVLNMSREE